ncbi:MAG: CoA ester lyase [Euryarchaeota archaeon]|nr:CoA ester lyase [Euryarchaeota archaeon]MDE2046489.1 CoA ester lyase [Thermoplasmata archaeon]
MVARPSSRPPVPPYRRCELSTPGHDLKMLTRAAGSSADLVLMDLEDGCAPSRKVAARGIVAEAARTLDWSGKVLAFRSNGLGTPYFLDDLLEVVGEAGEFLDLLVLPKITSAEEVRYVDRLLTQLEWRSGLELGRLRLEVLVETARGVLHAEEIAHASPRMAALLFGIYDYAGEVGTLVGEDTFTDLSYPRQALLAAARSAGLLALDGITSRYKDLALTRREAERSRQMGFDGRWAIHPSQIDVIQQAFTPTKDELEVAARRLATYREADRDGKGAIGLGEEMVDEATVRVEQRKVALGRRLGLLPP